MEGDEDARHELVSLIVERVYVQDEKIVAMTLRSNYHLALNHKTNEPTEFSVDPLCVMYGSDGLGRLGGRSCIVWLEGLHYPILMRYLLQKLVEAPGTQPGLLVLLV